MTATDLVIAAAVLAPALWILARSLRRSAGGCAGCHGGCAPRPPPEVIRLGVPPRSGGGDEGRRSDPVSSLVSGPASRALRSGL